MADEAIISAEYVEWKMVKTRKALQLIFEVPLEMQAHVQAALGTPMPDTSSPVAICRLVPAVQREEQARIEYANDDPGKPPRPLSQLAAILCNIVAFRRYISEESDGWDHIPTLDEATDWLKSNCRIASRKELDTDQVAAHRFREIRSGYDAWMRAA